MDRLREARKELEACLQRSRELVEVMSRANERMAVLLESTRAAPPKRRRRDSDGA